MAQDRADAVVREALAAAIRVGRNQRLPVDDPRVLSDGQNLLVHLAPSPVVARVATKIAWSRPDPFAWLAREVSVADHAARHGGPVVAPTDLADPGPHRSNGYALSLWTYVEFSDDRPAEAVVGKALAHLHMSLADYPYPLPDRLPVHAQIENGLAALERDGVLDGETLASLRARQHETRIELDAVGGTSGVLHGDAHPGNLLCTDAGWRWIDLEETGFGPREWDLGTLAIKVQDGDAALVAYAAAMGTPIPTPESLAPFQRARELETAIWALGMAYQDPEGYGDFAQARLAEVLNR